MDRDTQKLALLSNLQGIDVMIALVVIEEVGVFKKITRPVAYDDHLLWRIDGSLKRVSLTALHRATLASGIMYIRGLLEILGVKARKKLSEESGVHRFFQFVDPPKVVPGADLHWPHIEGASGMSQNVLKEYASRGVTIDDEKGELVPFDEAMYRVLKAGDKSIAHLTHLSEESSYYAGALVAVGSFVTVAVQEMILSPSWGDTFDSVVFENSRILLPEKHFKEHLQHVSIIRESLTSVLENNT